MMSCGYEPSAALGIDGNVGDVCKILLMWQLT
jgi:hypothetical protein